MIYGTAVYWNIGREGCAPSLMSGNNDGARNKIGKKKKIKSEEQMVFEIVERAIISPEPNRNGAWNVCRALQHRNGCRPFPTEVDFNPNISLVFPWSG